MGVHQRARDAPASFLVDAGLLRVPPPPNGQWQLSGQYVVSLACGWCRRLVVVELVEVVVRMLTNWCLWPGCMGFDVDWFEISRTFVDICQSVNTAIVHEQMTLELRWHNVHFIRREGLSCTGNIEAVAVNHCVAVQAKGRHFRW